MSPGAPYSRFFRASWPQVPVGLGNRIPARPGAVRGPFPAPCNPMPRCGLLRRPSSACWRRNPDGSEERVTQALLVSSTRLGVTPVQRAGPEIPSYPVLRLWHWHTDRLSGRDTPRPLTVTWPSPFNDRTGRRLSPGGILRVTDGDKTTDVVYGAPVPPQYPTRNSLAICIDVVIDTCTTEYLTSRTPVGTYR